MTAPREVPILWSGPLVLALLAGRKTQTRRLLPGFKFPRVGDALWGRETWTIFERAAIVHPVNGKPFVAGIGYRADLDKCGQVPVRDEDGSICMRSPKEWKPSIHLPRWACRLFHEVVAVREERLQDLTEEDARAEGMEFEYGHPPCDDWPRCPIQSCRGNDAYRREFMLRWAEIGGTSAPSSWASNPRVAVVTFRPRDAAP